MVAVEQKIKNGEKINDPRVDRFFALVGAVNEALRTITGQDLKWHRQWKAWWDKNEADFKVKE